MTNNFIKRTIKNGRIKFNNQIWCTKGDVSHLEGVRLVFGTYPPDYTFLSLWGSIAMYNNEENSWEEWCKLAGENPQICDNISCGYSKSLMVLKNGKFTAYKSKNIDWWRVER